MNTVTSFDYAKALAVILNIFTFNTLVPLVTLLMVFAIVWWMLAKAQQKPDFNIEQMFCDETGRPSTARVLACLAFAVSSWDLMSARLSDKATAEQFAYYLFAWSGALVFVKFADKWNGQMPLSSRDGK